MGNTLVMQLTQMPAQRRRSTPDFIHKTAGEVLEQYHQVLVIFLFPQIFRALPRLSTDAGVVSGHTYPGLPYRRMQRLAG